MILKISKFTIRVEEEEYNARSANRELEVLMKRHIAKFEKEHGKIVLESND